MNDAIHHFHNLYLRKATVTNSASRRREIRIFFSQDFHIYAEDAGEAKSVYYWIACGRDLPEVKELDSTLRRVGVEQMLIEIENYWSAWVNNGQFKLSLLPRDIIRMFKTSLLLMRTHVDHEGAILASCDSDVLLFNRDTYGYLWPRDGAIAAMAFDLAGFERSVANILRLLQQGHRPGGLF
jgi:GH15 family glucan-1,4-alpha-glucosidase